MYQLKRLLVFVLLVPLVSACGNPNEKVSGKIPDVSGIWGNQNSPYNFCGEVFTIPMTSSFKQDTEVLTGSFKMGFPGNISTATLTGTISPLGTINVTASFETNGDEPQIAVISLQLEEDTLKGTLTFKDVPNCNYDGLEDFVLEVTLKKGVDLPPPPPDDALEPNDDEEQATSIGSNSSHDLIFTYSNVDWFTFTLEKAQIVTAKVTDSLNLAGRYLGMGLYDSQGQWIQFANSKDAITRWGVEPGTYFLSLQMNSFGTPSVDYKLELSTQDLPDAAFEPNNNEAQAKPVILPFSQSLYLHGYDHDWFSFEVSEESLLNIQSSSEVEVILYKQPLQALSYSSSESNPRDYDVLLVPGTYYLRVSGLQVSMNYTLALALKPLPTDTSEPNNTQATATTLTHGFSGTLLMTPTDQDWFKFTLAEAGTITLDLGSNAFDNALALTFADDTNLPVDGWYTGVPVTRTFAAGTYYIRIEPSSYFYPKKTLTYPLTFTVQPLPDANLEPNNSFNTATPVTLPLNLSLYMFPDDEDWFRFSLTGQQFVQFNLSFPGSRCANEFVLELYDANGSSMMSHTLYPFSTVQPKATVLGAGTYYLKVRNNYVYENCSEPYNLIVNSENLVDSDLEPNNTQAQATPINYGFNREIVFYREDEDWFEFTLADTTQVKISYKNLTPQLFYFTLFDESGDYINYTITSEGDFAVAAPILPQGTYYIRFTNYYEASKYQLKFEKK